MKTAYSYQRWSTLLQGQSTRDSRDRQSKSADEWLANYGKGEYVLSPTKFIDPGKSGYKGENVAKDAQGNAIGELERFLQLVENETIKRDSILLIDEYSRFSRMKPSKSLALFMRVTDSGIGLVFTGSYEKRVINTDLIDKEPNVLQFIIGEMIRSYAESAEKSRKVKSAKQAKRERMQRGEIVPHNNIPKYFTYENGRYVHNANTAIVNELADGILAGKSLYGLADSLNAKQTKTFRYGFQWSGNAISKILRNRVLVGEYLGNKNYVEPIMNEEKFLRIQNILNQNTFNHGARGRFVNIFRGICYCADVNCGKSMQVATQSKTNRQNKETLYRYLRCSVNGIHSTCKNRHHIRLADMEVEFFMGFLSKNPFDLYNADDNAELRALSKQQSAYQAKIKQHDSDIADASELLGTLPIAELRGKLSKLVKEREAFKKALDALNAQIVGLRNAPKALGKWLSREIDLDTGEASNVIYEDTHDKTIAALQDNKERERIRTLLPALIGKITVDTMKGQFYIHNRMGNVIYTSRVHKSQRNNTVAWKKSLKGSKKKRTG